MSKSWVMNWEKYGPTLGGMSAIWVVLFHLDRNLNQTNEEDIFKLRHPVILTRGELFQRMVGKDEILVNSLHGQGIDRLGEGLIIQAISDDNVVEGISIKNHPNFGAAVQWHTEFHPDREEHSLSRRLYEAFGQAANQRMQSR